MLREARDPASSQRLRKLGFELDGVEALERARARLAEGMDRRWLNFYERARARYGRAVATVRERVCQGCFITLPTSAQPAPGDVSLALCESCGRILCWR